MWHSSIFVGGCGVKGHKVVDPLSDASTLFLQSAPSRQATRATELSAGSGDARKKNGRGAQLGAKAQKINQSICYYIHIYHLHPSFHPS